MVIPDPERIVRFVLDGREYELARADVEGRMLGERPRRVGTHAVLVNGAWYPVRQVFEVVTGIPGGLFNSHTARRHLERLDLEMRGDIQHCDGSVSFPARTASNHAPIASEGGPEQAPWHTEARVQALVVRALLQHGWNVVSQANTATKEPGIDVVASRGGQVAGIEVKGFPTRTYADPRRRDEIKPTQPSTQAGHWYAQALLAAMRLRTRQPDYLSVVALPDFTRYRRLFEETRGSLGVAGIRVWWVQPNGSVDGPQLV